MARRKLPLPLTLALLAYAAIALIAATPAAAQTETILHSFGKPKADGQRPTPGLAFDASGNLYGTAQFGGAYGYGMLFEFTPETGGGYTEHVIHNFNFNHVDGIYPQGGVILDAAGNLYGTTNEGGADGYGAVFEFSPHAGGTWTGKILYSFHALPDGQNPSAGLTFDPAGNLYGTTEYGGVHGANGGTVFKLTPSAGGAWSKKTLYSFSDSGTDGYYVSSGVVLDASGNVYGTTVNGGGPHGAGIAFELTPSLVGESTETILQTFDGVNGAYPTGLIFDASGNLYGGARAYGADGDGLIFELSPVSGGGWSESTIHTFVGGSDGFGPDADLIFDGSGNLYGTTGGGGVNEGGVVFELTPAGGGVWTESILYSFGSTGDGDGPEGLIFSAAGDLYGTTVVGGAYNEGTVYELVP
jgi:uncharacterized repeat protein (TIGR03803 family)